MTSTMRISRRCFLQSSIATTAAIVAVGRTTAADVNSQLRIAAIGVRGKGWSDLTATAASPKVRVVALCDIDESREHLGRASEKYPKAERFTDWRDLLDHAKDFDAVIVSTPDHMHCPISMAAMQLGKHLQCQKPLTHTVFEARQMRLAADKYKLVTQMGNQIQSHKFYRNAVKLVHDGRIGKVREVHSWQSSALGWMKTKDRPDGSDPVPTNVHWNLWLGSAPERPYKKEIYHPFNWRAWQDFSSGQLGDFGCHILDPVFMALGLTAPLSVTAEAPPMNREVWTLNSKVSLVFPSTERTVGKLPLTWYDGAGNMPAREGLALPEEYKLPPAGSVLLGEHGTLVIPHVNQPRLFPEDKFREVTQTEEDRDHYTSWAHACLGEDTATSHFGYASPLTEAVLLGAIAIRAPGETLNWNATDLRIENSAAANELLRKSYRSGWEPSWI
jgi:predicted dehydrogenase